jgi:TonB family protein
MWKRTLTVGVLLTWVASAALGQSQVYRPGNGVTLPTVVKEVHATELGGGTVVMDCVVRSDGSVGDVTVTQSAEKRLDDAAVQALKQWQFKPGTKDGKPVDVQVSIQMKFSRR